MTNVMLFFSQSFLSNYRFLIDKNKNTINEYVFVIMGFAIYYLFSVFSEFEIPIRIKKTQ